MKFKPFDKLPAEHQSVMLDIFANMFTIKKDGTNGDIVIHCRHCGTTQLQRFYEKRTPNDKMRLHLYDHGVIIASVKEVE